MFLCAHVCVCVCVLVCVCVCLLVCVCMCVCDTIGDYSSIHLVCTYLIHTCISGSICVAAKDRQTPRKLSIGTSGRGQNPV